MAHYDRLLFFFFFLCFGFALGDRHECQRLCRKNEPPKRCHYHFDIGVSQGRPNGNSAAHLSINKNNPGPLISVCQNDTIIVDVKNKLPSGLETAIHWHGPEGNSPYMDGVPMITQCPIIPHTTFRYQIKATKSGTFFYHAHSVSQQLDGIHGPLIIHSEKDQMYPSQTVVVSPQMTKLQVVESSYELDLNITGFRLDVFEDVVKGRQNDRDAPVRVRIINAAAMDCPVALYTHVVPLKIVAVDGNGVESSGISEIVLYPGERVDILIKSEVMKVTHVVGLNLCKGHSKYGLESGVSRRVEAKVADQLPTAVQLLQKLKPLISTKLDKASTKVFLPFDSTIFQNFKGSVDFRYKLGALTPYAPSILSENSVSLTQINKKSFLYPSSPLLSQTNDIPEDILCGVEDPSDRCVAFDNGFCECVHILNLPFNKQVDLILINEGKNSNNSEVIHIHGYSFYLLGMKNFERSITGAEVEEMDRKGEVDRNLVNPIKKDTIVIPNKGFAVLRLETTNSGKWLLESKPSKAKTGLGLEIILNIENPGVDKVIPEGFPACQTTKEPDLVFSSD